MSPEALGLFGQLLGGLQLNATDPQLVEKAVLIGRVRAELEAAIQAAKAEESA